MLESSNFVYMLRKIKCIAVNKTKVVRIIFAFFLYFYLFLSLSLSDVMIMEVFIKDFSVTTRPRILKFCTTIRYDKLNCVSKTTMFCLSVPLIVHYSFSLQCYECGNVRQRAVHQFISSFCGYIFNTLFIFLKVLQPLMATAGGM